MLLLKQAGQAAVRRLNEVLQPELAENVGKMLARNPKTGQATVGFELP